MASARRHTVLLALALAALALAGCGAPRVAGQRQDGFRTWLERSYESEMYQQDSVMLVDEMGDAMLIRKLDTALIKVSSALFRQDLPQAVLDRARQAAGFRAGETYSLDNDLLLSRFAEVMRLNYPEITPYIGREHEWSPAAERYLRYGFWHRLWRRVTGRQQDFPCPLFRRSKLFLCLACGWTSRYCITGTEAALTERILSYPDRSLQIHELFAESYVLNRGNVYMTLLACENVLAGRPHRAERADDPLQGKLSYIRSEAEELGDNYGAWYHFFGIALYGMLRTRVASTLVADTESIGSFFLEGPDRQEALINHHGAQFGHDLRRMILRGRWRE